MACAKLMWACLRLLTKILALNIFKYRSKEQLFFVSKFWLMLQKCLLFIITCPLLFWYTCNVCLLFLESENFNQSFIKDGCAFFVFFLRDFCGFSLSWCLVYRANEICQLLNQLIKLKKIHRELIGNEVHISRIRLVNHFLRELILCMFFVNLGWGGLDWSIAIPLYCRSMIAIYCCDVSMIWHYHLIEDLDNLIENSSLRKELNWLLCLEYLKELLQLRHYMEKVGWVTQTTRLVIEVSIMVFFCAYFIEFCKDPTDLDFLICGLLIAGYSSNMLRVISLAQKIIKMENRIFDQLYVLELRRISQRLSAKREILLDQMQLKRCTLQNSVTISNYIYVQESLVLETFNFIAVNGLFFSSLVRTYPS